MRPSIISLILVQGEIARRKRRTGKHTSQEETNIPSCFLRPSSTSWSSCNEMNSEVINLEIIPTGPFLWEHQLPRLNTTLHCLAGQSRKHSEKTVLQVGGARYFLEPRMKIGISYATVDGDETGLLRKFQSDWSTETRVMNPQRCAGMSPRNPP